MSRTEKLTRERVQRLLDWLDNGFLPLLLPPSHMMTAKRLAYAWLDAHPETP